MSLPSNSAETLLHQLQVRSQVAPPANATPVLLRNAAVGWALPAIVSALSRSGLAHPTPAGLQLPHKVTELRRVASQLHDGQLLKGWRHEELDILDTNDRVLGRIERAAMRALGLRTRAVHLHALGPNNRIWVARRAEHKSTDPGLWDTLVGGLVGAGEQPETALLRESNEEAGLDATDLTPRQVAGNFTVCRTVPEGYQVETTQVWACRLPDHCKPRNQDGEVSAIELATEAEVLQAITKGDFTLEAALSILQWLTRRPSQAAAGD